MAVMEMCEERDSSSNFHEECTSKKTIQGGIQYDR